MHLAISNLAWNENHDFYYALMQKYGFTGLEIAPSKWGQEPYKQPDLAKNISTDIFKNYHLTIVSMQALLFGTEGLALFEGEEKRNQLKAYLKKAILYAEAINCPVLVFGNPKNRITQNLTRDYPIALDFFKELGDFAKTHQTCLCIEPNPADYGTNFINTLEEANVLVDEVKSEGFKMIVDTSTMILNQTQPEKIQEIIANVRHIHISMPFLKPLSVEYLNYENWLKNFIFAVRKTNYDRYLSIEMLNATAPEIENSLKIIQEITHSKL